MIKVIFIVIILIVIIFGFARWNFNRQVNQEIEGILSQGKDKEVLVVTEQMLTSLPGPVQKWLINTGIVGKEKIHTVYLKQTGQMRLKQDQEKWTRAEAEQYITTDNPAFLWKVNMSMMPFINVVGRDLFRDGQGEMQIKIASLIPIVNIANNYKVNQSELQRYLAEILWYPTAALSPFIKWEEIDEQTAKATMTYKEVTGSVTFHFNKKGDVLKITAQRYKDSGKDAELKEWVGEVKENSILNGIKIENKIDISWILDGKVFTWYKLEIFDVKYN